MKLGCVISAAGRSERFGGNKLLQILPEGTVLSYALRAVPRDRFEKCVVVVIDDAVEREARRAGYTVRAYPGGLKSDTVKTGLAAMPGLDGYMFVNADQPLLKKESLLRLISAFMARPDRAVRLSARGVPGNPVLFPGRFYDDLMGLTGDRGGSALIKSGICPADMLETEPAELLDADTPEALDDIRTILEREGG